MTSFDAASVRGLYTGLSDGWTYLNAHVAPQVAEKVAAGVSRAFRTAHTMAAATPLEAAEAPAGTHSASLAPGTLEADVHLASARMAVADLVGARADAVVLGPSLPVLYHLLARAMRPLLRHRSSIVLSALDAPELTQPFADTTADVRWAQPDLGTGELPAYQYGDLVDGSTRLVSLGAAHPLLGTVARAETILEEVHARSRAWTLLDISALAPYRPVDMKGLGADIVGVDLGKLGGPQLAALVFRDTAMFKRLDTASLDTPVSAGLAGGVGPLVDHIAQLAGGERGSRRKRLARSMDTVHEYLDDLRADLYIYLDTLESVHILGYSGEAAVGASKDRIPRLSFAVRDVPAAMVHQRLFDNGLVTSVTPQTPLLEEMGVAEVGGAVTVALGPFNTHQDIEHLTRVVASLA